MLKKNLKAATATVVGFASAFVAAAASATVDPSVSTAMTAVKADATELSGIVTPIIISVMGLTIVIKLIKRFGNKV